MHLSFTKWKSDSAWLPCLAPFSYDGAEIVGLQSEFAVTAAASCDHPW